MKNLTLTLGTKRLAPTSLTGETGHQERRSYVGGAFRLLAVVGLSVVVPSLWGQQTQTAALVFVTPKPVAGKVREYESYHRD